MSEYKDYDQKTLTKLHQVQIELLDEFVRICEKHNLTYFLIYGTLLGEVRHQGVIPWDDDIDVGMPRSDYDKFLKIAPTELDSKYFLDCLEYNDDYYLPFAKIKKNGTIFDEEISHCLNNHKGIFMDIFPLENVYANNVFLKYHSLMAFSITDTIFYKQKMKTLKNTIHPIIVRCLSILPKKSLQHIQRKHMTYCHDDNSMYMSVLGAGYGYRKDVNLRSNIMPPKKVIFAGKEYNGMHDNDQYLKHIYGNYLELPPVEKRRNHMPLEIDFGKNKKVK